MSNTKNVEDDALLIKAKASIEKGGAGYGIF